MINIRTVRLKVCAVLLLTVFAITAYANTIPWINDSELWWNTGVDATPVFNESDFNSIMKVVGPESEVCTWVYVTENDAPTGIELRLKINNDSWASAHWGAITPLDPASKYVGVVPTGNGELQRLVIDLKNGLSVNLIEGDLISAGVWAMHGQGGIKDVWMDSCIRDPQELKFIAAKQFQTENLLNGPEKAIDGDVQTEIMSELAAETFNWWQGDLGQQREIRHIEINYKPLLECIECSEALKDGFHIVVSNEDLSELTLDEVLSLAETEGEGVSVWLTESFIPDPYDSVYGWTFPRNTKGRYLSVWVNNSNLFLTEVGVVGYKHEGNGLLWETWDNVEGSFTEMFGEPNFRDSAFDFDPSNLRAPKYPENPSNVAIIPTGQSSNYGNHYGSRLRGWFTAPISGLYEFYIKANGVADLRLTNNGQGDVVSTNAVASVAESTELWNANNDQRTAPYILAQGESIYIDIRHKEDFDGGNDNTDMVALGYEVDSNGTIDLVPNSLLSPYDGPECGPNTNCLIAGGLGLLVGEKLITKDATTSFRFVLQPTGQAELIENSSGEVEWSSLATISGSSLTHELILMPDGNLVLVNDVDGIYWESGTANKGVVKAQLEAYNDGDGDGVYNDVFLWLLDKHDDKIWEINLGLLNPMPIIHLNRDSVTHSHGEPYNDVATCEVAATLTCTIAITDSVPVFDAADPVAGTYTLTLTATDSNGNTTTATRNVVVISATEWVGCASDGGACEIPGGAPIVVRYGAAGSWAYQYNLTGSVECSAETFADPLPGATKACEYSTEALSRGANVNGLHAVFDNFGLGLTPEQYLASTLNEGEKLTTVNDVYNLVLQPDGNLVLRRTADGHVLWHSATYDVNWQQSGDVYTFHAVPNGMELRKNGVVYWSVYPSNVAPDTNYIVQLEEINPSGVALFLHDMEERKTRWVTSNGYAAGQGGVQNTYLSNARMKVIWGNSGWDYMTDWADEDFELFATERNSKGHWPYHIYLQSSGN
jgi:hypothetical protein